MPEFESREQDRFWSHVVQGPAEQSCWLWTGAIGDDGYGRFWISDQHAPNGQRAVRPHRWALAHALGGWESIDGLQARHWFCDVPLCVRATADADTHIIPGTHAQNMADRAARGRNPPASVARWRFLSRAERAAQSRALRDAIRDRGWEPSIIRDLLLGIDPDAPTLF